MIEAVTQVETVPGVKVDRVELDELVTLTEIADRTGKTFEAVRLWAEGKRREGFPQPAAQVGARSRLWRWSDIAAWLGDPTERQRARTVAAVNGALELRRAHQTLDAAALEQLHKLARF